MLPPVMREAREYLEAICKEIGRLGEPANPQLGEMLARSMKVLAAGGAVTGWYGVGKTLLAYLTALALGAVRGQAAIVIDANRVLRHRGARVQLGEISEYARVVSLLDRECIERITSWAGSVVGGGGSGATASYSGSVEVPEGRGFKPLIGVLEELIDRYSLVIVDEFERIALNPEYYGFGSSTELREEFFNLVDSKPERVGLTIPPSIWVLIDIETSARLQPILNISTLVDPRAMLELARRYLAVHAGEENADIVYKLVGLKVRIRVPRTAIVLAYEALTRGVERLVEDRLRVLSLIAALHPRLRSQTSKIILAVLYTTVWLEQHAYSMFSLERIGDAISLMKKHEQVLRELFDPIHLHRVTREMSAGEVASRAVRLKLLQKLGEWYTLSQRAINHLREVLGSKEGRLRLSEIYPYVEELAVELQVWLQ